MKIGIFYGSSTGNTESVANKIKDLLGDADIKSIADINIDELTTYDLIILGSSTWGSGELQDDWFPAAEKLSGLDLKGKKAALFGTGDQSSYSDTFVDALAILHDALQKAGADIIGAWPAEGYDYSDSQAVKDGMFVGLAIDEDNQSDLTDERINKWVSRLKENLPN